MTQIEISVMAQRGIGRRGAASAGTADNAIQAKIAVETAGYVSQSGVNIMV